MSLLKKLAGQTVLYGVSSILGRTLNFLLTPLFATYLTVSEFGVSVDIYSIAAVLNIIYLFGFETTYFRFARKEASDENSVFNQIESTLLVSSLVLSALLVALASPLATFLEYPNSVHYIYYLAIILFTDTVVAIPFARLRLNNKAASFALIKIVNIVLNVLLNIFFLVVCKAIVSHPADYPSLYTLVSVFYTEGDNVKYVFLSNIIANALLIPIFFRSFLKLQFKIDFTQLQRMFQYAYPLVILGLAGMVNEMLSRMIFKKVLPEGFYSNYTEQEALGIFGACYKLSMFMSLAIQSFRYSAEPFFFSQSTDKNAPATFAVVMKWFVIVCLALFLVVSLNVELIGTIMLRKDAYQMGLHIVPILLLANLFLGVCFNLSISFKLTDNNIWGTYISIGGAAITIVLNFLLIPILGFTGSAIATLVCYASMSVALYWKGKQFMDIPYYVGHSLAFITFAVGIVLFNEWLDVQDGVWQLVLSAFFVGVFMISVFVIEKKRLY